MSLETTITINLNDQASAGLAKIGKNLKGFGSNLGSLGSGMQSLGRGLTLGVTAPVVAGLGAAANSAIQFEEAMAGAAKAIGGTPEEMQSIGNGLREMSTVGGIPMLPRQLAEIAASAGELGLKARGDILSFTETAAKVGVAFDISASQAGESMATLSNVMNVPIAEIGGFAGVINHLSANMKARAPEIANAVGRIGGTARNFGLAREETAALAASFIALGKPPEVAATAINSMLVRMQTATQQSGRFQNGLEQIGMGAAEMETAVRDKGIGAIEDLLGATSKLSEGDRTKALSNLFGAEFGDDVALLAGNTQLFAKALGDARSEQAGLSSLQSEFDTRSATTANQMKLLGNQMSNLGITFGSALLPPINAALGAITPLAQKFADFAAENPGITKIGVAVAGVAAAAGPALIAVGGIVSAVSSIAGAFAAGGVLAGVGTFLGGLALGPIAVGAAGVAAAGLLIYRNWGRIKEVLGPVVERMKTFGADFMAGLQPALAEAMPAIQTIGGHLRTIGGDIARIIGGVIEAGTSFWNFASSVIEAIAPLAQKFTPLGSAINLVKSLFPPAGAAANTFGGQAGAAIGRVIGAVTRLISFTFRIIGAFTNVAASVTGVVNGLASRMFTAGANIVNRLADGIRSGIGAVRDAASSAASAVMSFLPNSPVPYGPLTALNRAATNPGGKIIDMLGAGMASRSLLNPLAQAVRPVTSAAGTTGGSPLSSRPGPLQQALAPRSSGGGSMTFHYEPRITINGAQGNALGDFRQALRAHADEIGNIIGDLNRENIRLSYS